MRCLRRASSTRTWRLVFLGVAHGFAGHAQTYPIYTQAQIKEFYALTDSSSYYSFVKNDLPNALRCAQQAQDMARRIVGEKHFLYASTYTLMAEAYFNARAFEQAIRYGEEHTRRLKPMIVNTDQTNMANGQYSKGLLNLAEIYASAGRVEEAQQKCLECLQINRYRYPEATTSVIYQLPLLSYIQCKTQLANLYFTYGQQATSIPLYEEALRLQKECYAQNPSLKFLGGELCEMLNNLAVIHADMGNYHFAEIAYKEALYYAEKALPDARDIYTSALSIYTSTQTNDTRNTYISALSNLAQTLFLLGQATEADVYLKKADVLAKEWKCEGSYGLLKANMAVVCSELSLETRLRLRQEALELLRRPNDIRYVPAVQFSLAQDFMWIGKYSKAQKQLHQANKLYYQIHQKMSQGHSTAVASQLALARHKPRQALKLTEKALEEYPSHHAALSELWESKAVILSQLGRHQEATLAWKKTLELMDAGVKKYFPYLSEAQREDYLSRYDTYRDLYFSAGLSNPNVELLGAELYDETLRFKGVLLETIRQTNLYLTFSTDSVFSQKRNQYTQVKRLLSRYYQSSNKAQFKTIDSLETTVETLEKELSRSVPVNHSVKPSWKQIQQTLKPQEVAVEIVRFNVSDTRQTRRHPWEVRQDSICYAALVVHAGQSPPQVVLLPKGKALESKHLSDYRADIQNRSYDADTYAHFWQPIQAAIGSARTVYFAPDGVYHLINLHTLRNTATGQFLGNELDIHLLNSTRTLVESAPKPPANPSIVLFGYPNYHTASSSPPKDTLHHMSYDSRPDLVRGGAYFRPLPGTKVEVESIATLAQRYQWQVALYTSDNASEANLNRISPPTVLHIATHGYFLKDTTSVQRLSKRALLNSGLVMAGALDSTRHTPLSDNDGLLTAYEATALRLSQTELVALSACETGLGELRSGNGVFGLQRAFFAAGARSVLMSLWKVNDQTTQMFMAKFYGYWLAGKPKSTALRLAQEDIRNTSEQLSHPFYWGGFVLLEQ